MKIQRVRFAGQILLASLIFASAPQAQAQLPSGEDLFDLYCSGCHEVGPANGQGPSLKGVVGRKVASVKGFAYSPVLKAAGTKGTRWDAATLDRFLTDPSKAYPGTAMPQSVSKPENRKAIIAYLKSN
ncbi:MAG: c-type cytochrome [Asticcacaulis sp.]